MKYNPGYNPIWYFTFIILTVFYTDTLQSQSINGVTKISYPENASLRSNANVTVTGAIKIKMPSVSGTAYANIRMRVEIFDQFGEGASMWISGFLTGGNWNNISTELINSQNDLKHKVYYGFESGHAVV